MEGGKFTGAIIMQFANTSYIPSTVAWFERRCDSLTIAVEQAMRYQIMEKQLSEKSMQW